jgi:DNA-directed RNA polymerase specialized sigma24 family protein
MSRRKMAVANGGQSRRVDAQLDLLPAGYKPHRIVEINERLETLWVENPEVAQLVELRFFAGFSLKEIAQQRGICERTVYRHWSYAKAWFRESIEQENAPT